MNYIEEIKNKIEQYRTEGKSLFTSSSFQTHSTVLLHIISKIDNTIPVYFLNTGFHFPETIQYKEQITKLFSLSTVDLFSSAPKSLQTDEHGRLLFTSDPDYCCYLNKIQPLEPMLDFFDIWINGVRADQNENRKTFHTEEKTTRKAKRYHPMLQWKSKMIYDYINENNIPNHPLDEKGYVSIGCEPCTRKINFDMLN
ncbi:MAG: phosphoadenylyl-sulfate reductase, partial [Fimbriimonadaceae bacterium]|nr:phosphoadenylyl-sulfate reductase [Chitinophagales bacterium]